MAARATTGVQPLRNGIDRPEALAPDACKTRQVNKHGAQPRAHGVLRSSIAARRLKQRRAAPHALRQPQRTRARQRLPARAAPRRARAWPRARPP